MTKPSHARTLLGLAGSLALVAGSALAVVAQTEQLPPTASAGCSAPLVAPGEYDGVNTFDAAAQAYRVVVPDGYAELVPAPLIIWLAAGGGTLVSNFDLWRPYIDEVAGVFVVVEQTKLSDRRTSTLTALIDRLSADYCIDSRRVHAMGASSSAPTVSAFACEASDRIASFVASIGVLTPTCTPQRPVPLLAITGDPERRVVTASVEAWAEVNGCDPDPQRDDLGAGVTRVAYMGCDADVVFYDIEGVGHGLVLQQCAKPAGQCIAHESFDQLAEAERFFAGHPLADEGTAQAR